MSKQSFLELLMTLSGFLAYSGALAIAAIIPGPQIVAIIAQALHSGYRRAAWMTAGMVVGDVIYLSSALAGLAYIAATFTTLLIVIKWTGVVYLCWLAYRFWNAPNSLLPQHRSSTAGGVFASGILVTLGNPKSVLFYVSILPTVVDVNGLSSTDIILLLAMTAVILAVAQYPFALAGARARMALTSPRAMSMMNRSAAFCMGGAAVAIATRS
ncbi:LysE family translocator [Rhizobium lentis]|nr:LysE family translocator [Rhizobium lentis]MBB4574543.1 threonine/homoserine/homoserine lactone efflux protein [Rhizobium lentis]MBB5550470.1 threonine/homoserine/homoserine lactone efflux protein [Rhizobium lentis]MBB5567589.1 threonine/homoserine/homoserine lactone efflux protein [Rhizobium lentis]MEB3047466.1 LysE family translocator [Rhizobium sp. MJ21]